MINEESMKHWADEFNEIAEAKDARITELEKQLAAHDAKIIAEAKAEALERFADYVGSELPEAHSAHIEDDCRRMAAEYRAKAAEAGRKE